MKKFISFSLLVICSYSLRAQTNTGEASSTIISQLMKDSLSLNDVQKQQIYDANIQIYQQKQKIRQKYKYSDSLGYLIKMSEIKKDSLYKLILPSDKYQLYQEKKFWFYRNN